MKRPNEQVTRKAAVRERIKRGDAIAGVMGMASGMGIRFTNGECDFAFLAEGAIRLAKMLDLPELVDAIQWGFKHPRASSDDSTAELYAIKRRHSLMPACYRCRGKGKESPSLNDGPCGRCAGTGREI